MHNITLAPVLMGFMSVAVTCARRPGFEVRESMISLLFCPAFAVDIWS